jgi:hypothetical protein
MSTKPALQKIIKEILEKEEGDKQNYKNTRKNLLH